MYREFSNLETEVHALEYEIQGLRAENEELKVALHTLKAKCQEALCSVTPKFTDIEAMRTFYEAIASIYDADGWVLFRNAQKILGITSNDMYSHYAYEDNRGRFENANGKALLPWLEAMHFGNVEWSIVANGYEAATLLPVTANKAYDQYQHALYCATLKELGFEAAFCKGE